MNKKNIIYLVLDSLRPDRLGYMGHQPSPSYNLDNIANSSTRCTNTFTGGNPTEFSLPYLLTSSYLLDHGGYANGIEHRPITLAEVLSNNGYRTAYISGLYERSSGAYARGFDDVYKIYDFNKLPVDIENTLPHYRKLNKDNKISSIECIEELTPYFEAWFNDVIEHCKDLSNLLSEKELPSSLIFENYNFIEIIKETEYEFNKFKQQPDQYILNVLSGNEFGLVKIINKFVTNT